MNRKTAACGLAAAAILAGTQGAWGAYGGSGTFTKIASRADLTDGYYVVASSNGLMALNNVNYGSFFTNSAISPSANVLTDPPAAIVWLIQTNATYGGLTIFNEASNRFVSYSGTANAAYAAGAVNGTTGVWSFAYGAGAFDVANVATNTRLLQYNAAAPRFACYTTVQQKLALYKMAAAADVPPSFGANPGPLGATSGVAMAFTVTASGSPAPALALQSQTASAGFSFTPGTGQLSYTPPQADGGATQTFTFTASNSAGVATQTVGVAVTAGTAPAFTSGTSYGATSLVAMAFTVTASGTPAPTLALLGEDAAGSVSFTPGTGVLNYTPAAGDVGTRTFTFTAANVAGTATQNVSVVVVDQPVAPSFTSGTSYGATALVAVAFTVAASGNPAPTLALQSEDAAGSVVFTPATGALDYTPATNDVGNRSFVFTASNVAGTATQTVTVAVAAAPTTIPTVSVTNVATNGFTINWTACTDATNYQVQVATDTNFAAGSASEALSEAFATLTDTAVPSGWSTDKSSDLDYTGEPYVGAAAPAYKFGTSGQWLQSPAFAPGATNLQFFAYGNGGAGSTIAVSALVSGVWTLMDTVVVAANDGTYNVALNPQTTQLKFSFTKVYNCGFDDVVVQAVSASASLVLDRTVAALTTDATGLDSSTTYYVRARREGGEWSEIVSAATADPAPTVPAFNANPGPIAATATLAKAFSVGATGFPAPTLSLQGTTASGGYAFTAGTGTLDYTPPESDVGTRTFTFAASNVAGVAMQTVTVTVAAAPVYVPTVTVTNVGPTFFTANWNEVTDAATYQIQIGTDTNFSTSVAGSNVLSQTFATLTDTTPPSGWTSSLSSDLDSTVYYGAAPPSFKFNLTGQWLQSPVFAAGGTNLQFWAYGRNGAGSTFAISGLVSGVWTPIATVSIARNGATYSVPLDPQTTQIKFSFTRIVTVYLDDVVVQGATVAGSLVRDETVAALTYGATGLSNSTPYHVRVRAAPTGTWSAVVSTATLGNEPLAPWFTGGAGPYATTAGVAVAFTETALGVPDPALALAGTTAAPGSYAFTPETGYLIYAPPLGDVGAQTFTFTASNATGVATQTVEVAVAAATAPAFTSGTAYGATTLVTRVIVVEASGSPRRFWR